MPQPSVHDGLKVNKVYQKFKSKNEPWTKASLEDVLNSSKKLFSNSDDFIFIKGKVENTLIEKNNIPEKISFLRLDTDFYESTKIELETLYPRVSKKGVLIIDDYGDFPGCRKAVDEYFLNKNVLMIGVDKSCRVIIKD